NKRRVLYDDWSEQASTNSNIQRMHVARDYRHSEPPFKGKVKLWVPHRDKVPAPTPLLGSNYLSRHQVSVLPRPPYFSDLAPCCITIYHRRKICLRDNDSQVPEK
ncbi:hypothetical protein AVEN_44333-1, partial [Araneus ventricosus]